MKILICEQISEWSEQLCNTEMKESKTCQNPKNDLSTESPKICFITNGYLFLSDFESTTEKIRALFAETINMSWMQQNAKHSNNPLVVLCEYWQNALGRWMDSECTVFMLQGKSVCWIDGSITTTLQGIVSRNSACNSILLGHPLR